MSQNSADLPSSLQIFRSRCSVIRIQFSIIVNVRIHADGRRKSSSTNVLGTVSVCKHWRLILGNKLGPGYGKENGSTVSAIHFSARSKNVRLKIKESIIYVCVPARIHRVRAKSSLSLPSSLTASGIGHREPGLKI